MNYLFCDAETTGLSEYKNDIIQLACIPIVNGIKMPSFNEFCQPVNWNNIDANATAVHGITVEMMKGFQTQEEMLIKFIDYIESFNVKFVVSGFNVSFDKKFLSATFSRYNKSKEFFKLFTLNIHDTYIRAKSVKNKINSVSLKLEVLANLYEIPIKAHDALSDIEATIAVDKIISSLLEEDTKIYKPEIDINTIQIQKPLPEMAQLHIHSQYNMIDGVVLPEDWYKWAANNNVPGLAITDQSSGVSLYSSIRNKENTVAVSAMGFNIRDGQDIYDLNAYAISNDGYKSLVKLASIGYENIRAINGIDIPTLDAEDLNLNRKGLVFSCAGINGAIGKALQVGDKDLAITKYEKISRNLGEFYLELNPIDIIRVWDPKVGFRNIKSNNLILDGNIGKAYNLFIAELIDSHGAKAIPTTSASFIDPEDKIVQDCLSKNAHKDGKFYEEEYIIKKSDQVFKELKQHLTDWLTEDKFIEFVNNTLSIVNRAKSVNIDHGHKLPKIDIPDNIKQKSDDYNTQTYLYLLEKIKQHGRWKEDPEYKARFAKEIDVIMKNKAMNFIPYFLVYEDISDFSRKSGFLQSIGRGSAGGCLISYYLKIIHVDPVKSNLPFERFLSHARINAGSWPDIDMDISRTARPVVMKYLQKKYKNGFAQIATFSTMKTKNAIKDAMSAVYQRNRNDFEIKQVCDTIPDSPQGTEEKDFLYGYTDMEGEYHRGHVEDNPALQSFFVKYPDVKNLVDRLLGVVRGISRHASAFVISTDDLRDGIVPLMKMYDNGMKMDINVTHFRDKMCEASGLVKADILGLNTMSMVTDCVNLLKDKINYLEENENGMASIYRLPEDEGVYLDFYNEKTDSSFQFNTSIVKSTVKDFMPTQREHLSIMTALLRPGAMDAEIEPGVSATQWYMDVRMGKREPKYIHDDLRPYIEETYGVYCYQEQIMATLVGICGYSLEETDQIRAAIAKKKHDVMMSAFSRIREATRERGWTPEQSDALCQTIQAFSNYSFNRSHSFCYGELGYITMYLKHHHPLEWWTAVLNNEKTEDKTRSFISLLGETVRPPAMNKPSDLYQVNDDHIIAPISAIKGIGPTAVKELAEKGPFISLEDYVARVRHNKVNKGVIEALVKARAVDCFLNKSLATYQEQKKDFLDRYEALRKTKINWTDDVLSSDPMRVFFMEKEVNKTFNKDLLADKDVKSLISKRWPNLIATGRRGIPFIMDNTPVLTNIRVAEGLLSKDHDKQVSMIMLYGGSSVRKGISKKSGKPYQFLSLSLSDGYIECEAVDWKGTRPLRLKHDTVVYVKGTLRKGFKTSLSINITEIQPIE